MLSLRESADPDCLNYSLANVLYFEVGSFDLTGLLYYCYFILLVFGVDGRWSYGHFMLHSFFLLGFAGRKSFVSSFSF